MKNRILGLNMVDIAPNSTGSLYGIVNMASAVAAFFAPIFANIVDFNWNLVFGFAVAFYVAGFAIFCKFARFKPQIFNEAKDQLEPLM